MFKLRLSTFVILALVLGVLFGGIAYAKQSDGNNASAAAANQAKAAKVKDKIDKRVTQADREAAAARAAAAGLTLPTAETAAMALPSAAPHYFSVANYANSQLPTISGAVISVGNPLIERAYATDAASAVLVVVPTPLPDGLVQSFDIFNQVNPGASGGPSAGNSFHAYILRPTGTPNEYLVVFDSGLLTVPAVLAGNMESFTVPDIAVQAGDVLAFYGQGVPLDIGAGTDILSYPAPLAPTSGATITLDTTEYPIYPQARTYSFAASVLDLGAPEIITGGIRKFVDGLPLLDADGANNLGQFIPVAVRDTTTYPGSDYYVIGLVQYREQMHSDLNPTLIRGYVQLSTGVVPGGSVPTVPLANAMMVGADVSIVGYTGVTAPHYMGPLINATKDRPVRIKFVNLLPTGEGGNLFLPVDTTVMGSGMNPDGAMMEEPDPRNPLAGQLPKPLYAYTENRATLHLHGGISPWISDGTPHQWITPANDVDQQTGDPILYPEGVSVRAVPDMAAQDPGDPRDGVMTFYYTNQQSARLMFCLLYTSPSPRDRS